MKFTLRDFLWLQILVVVALCWAWEHRHLAKVLVERKEAAAFSGLRTRGLFLLSGPNDTIKPSNDAKAQEALLLELQSLSNEELVQRVADEDSEGSYWVDGSNPYSLCLAEMVRRRMHDELQKFYDDAKARIAASGCGESTTELLTALRRAQGHPDPLNIQVVISQQDSWGRPFSYPKVFATLRNVDHFKEPIFYRSGGDGYRGDRWRIRLTDVKGRIIEGSIPADYPFFSRIGRSRINTIPFEKDVTTELIDLRDRIERPAAGIYTLQVIHCDRQLNSSPNLDGLIVRTSDPIRILVENGEPSEFAISALPLLCLSIFACSVFIVKYLGTLRRPISPNTLKRAKSLSRRDFIYSTIAFIVLFGWLYEDIYMRATISIYRPDPSVDWKIRVIE